MISSSGKSKAFKRQVIIRKIKRTIHEPPKGAWKIAYADFVTALMAFFLMLWLLSAVSVSDRKAIEEYFKTPLMVVLAGGSSEDITSSVIVSDYGDDKTMASGQVKSGEKPAEKITISLEDAGRLLRLQEMKRLHVLKTELEHLIDTDPKLSRYKDQLLIDMTTEGLRIMIVDVQNRPMFEVGSAALQPYAIEILQAIGKTLNQVPNRIGLSGHTDAIHYQGGGLGYSNWELSSDRANASRRELISGGMDQTKILRVVGLADSVLFNPADPSDAHNRRISIIVMNQKAEAAVREEGGQ
ncbi:MAG: flagellar motor protein MotB [Gallionella sp.]|jgi:chemotaxis protein MotB